MKIQSTHKPANPARPAAETVVPSPNPRPNSDPPKPPDWREFTLNEAMVELPQAGLSMLNPSGAHSAALCTAQTAVSALAFARAYQAFQGGSVEQKLEGASSLALGVGGVLSMLPGQTAAFSSQAFMATQSALEITLGLRELHEELLVDQTPDWKEIATGSLDVIKGTLGLAPLIWPSTTTVSNCVQSVALIGKAVLESTLHRTTDE